MSFSLLGGHENWKIVCTEKNGVNMKVHNILEVNKIGCTAPL